MYKFQVGDRVTIRKAPRELYPSKDSFVSFPDRLEGVSTKITSIENGPYGMSSFYVEKSFIRLFEFELIPERQVDLSQEAEWE